MQNRILLKLVLLASLASLLLIFLLAQAPPALGCTFAALKSVTLVTDPPRPAKGKPCSLNAILLYGGGMGHGNMLTSAENAISATLQLPESMVLTEGSTHVETASPEFQLGYETTYTMTWQVVANKSGRQHIGIDVTNTTWGQGQESCARDKENGLLSWEVIQPTMKDTRIENGDKDAISTSSLSLMPSLNKKKWSVLSNGDVLYTDAEGIIYSAAAGELALGKDDPSPVLTEDKNGNRYVFSNGDVEVVEGIEVGAPEVQPLHPNSQDRLTVQARIVGDRAPGKPVLFYSSDGITWKSAEMEQIEGASLWKLQIPPQGKSATTISYYLKVTDSAARTITTPRYSVPLLSKKEIDDGVRNVTILMLLAIVLGIGAVVVFARWDIGKRAKRAREAERRILANDRAPLQPQRVTGVLNRLARPAPSALGYWWIGFVILMILGVVLTIIGIVTDQFQIINLIIRMG